jgi:hypothetical protein
VVYDEPIAGGFVGVLESGNARALSAPVSAEASEVGVGLVDGELGDGNATAGIHDELECGFQLSVVARLVEDEGQPVVVNCAYPKQAGEHRIFPPKPGATSGRKRLEGSFDDLLGQAKICNFRFHDLRHTFASWFMMLRGDLYTFAKILGHSGGRKTSLQMNTTLLKRSPRLLLYLRHFLPSANHAPTQRSIRRPSCR